MKTLRRSLTMVSTALCLSALTFVCGCMSLIKELPASYFQPRRELAIVVTRCPERPELLSDASQTTKPTLRNAAFIVRQEAMKTRLESLKPDRIQKDVQTQLGTVFQPHFAITTATNQLVLEVEIRSWGWVVPVDKIGVATEGYKFSFRGTSTIRDCRTGGATVAHFYNGAEVPIDIPVVEESCLRAYPSAVKAFAENVGKYLFKNRPGAAPASPSK